MLKINYNYICSFIVTFFFIFSLNINPNNFFTKDTSYLNYIRFFLPFFGLFYFYFISAKNNKNIIKISLEFKLIILIYIVFFITNLLNGFNLNILYFLNYFCFFLYIIILKKFYKSKILFYNFILIILFYLIGLLGLTLIKIYSSDLYSFKLIFVEIVNLRDLFIFHEKGSALGNNPSPNSTGAARVLVLLLILLIFYDLRINKLSFKLGSIIMIISFIVISLQSKFAFGSILIAYLTLLILLRYNFKKFISNILFVLIIPYLIFIMSNHENRYSKTLMSLEGKIQTKEFKLLNKKAKENNEITGKTTDEISDQIVEEEIEDLYKKKDRKKIIGEYDHEITTGRSTIWSRQYNYIKKNNYLLIGKGIFTDLKIFGISSSNSLIYSWLSGGMIAVIILVIFYLKVFFVIMKSLLHILFKKRKIENNFIFQVLLMVLLLRTIVENSFVSIQLDLFFMIFLIELYKIKKLSLSKNFNFINKF